VFDNIVVGTDGSERAARAVSQAAELALASDSTLHVIHAYRGTRDSIESAGRQVVDRVSADLAETGVRIQTHALQGDPADVMIDWSQTNAADLIVVGNRGMTGTKGRLLGSIPNAVSHNATGAVLIVQTQQESPSFHVIVVGTDGSERAGRAVALAAELANTFGAQLHLVLAYKGVEQAAADALAAGAAFTAPSDLETEAREEHDAIGEGLEAQAEALRARGIEVDTHAVSTTPARAILDVAGKVGADLVVVGNRGMTGAKRVLGSVPNTLTHQATCAVLIVPTDDPDPT
jgi:nucleotide-binding universal stress UspA family protein